MFFFIIIHFILYIYFHSFATGERRKTTKYFMVDDVVNIVRTICGAGDVSSVDKEWRTQQTERYLLWCAAYIIEGCELVFVMVFAVCCYNRKRVKTMKIMLFMYTH